MYVCMYKHIYLYTTYLYIHQTLSLSKWIQMAENKEQLVAVTDDIQDGVLANKQNIQVPCQTTTVHQYLFDSRTDH